MSTDPTRTAQIAAARRMLDWLEANPDVPLTPWGTDLGVSHSVLAADDETGMAKLQEIANALGVAVADSFGHPGAVKSFGSVEYRAYYVPRTEAAAWKALMSYGRNVQPGRAS